MTDCPEPKKPWELPFLYILFRGELDASRGKVGAQTAHAANKLETLVKSLENYPGPQENIELFNEWKESSGQGFGVTIILDVSNFQTLASVINAAKKQGFLADTVFDESYPVPDGKFMHSVPCVTCGFVFGKKGQLAALTKHFPLLS